MRCDNCQKLCNNICELSHIGGVLDHLISKALNDKIVIMALCSANLAVEQSIKIININRSNCNCETLKG